MLEQPDQLRRLAGPDRRGAPLHFGEGLRIGAEPRRHSPFDPVVGHPASSPYGEVRARPEGGTGRVGGGAALAAAVTKGTAKIRPARDGSKDDAAGIRTKTRKAR